MGAVKKIDPINQGICAALDEGELSGEPEAFDFTGFKQRKLDQHSREKSCSSRLANADFENKS